MRLFLLVYMKYNIIFALLTLTLVRASESSHLETMNIAAMATYQQLQGSLAYKAKEAAEIAANNGVPKKKGMFGMLGSLIKSAVGLAPKSTDPQADLDELAMYYQALNYADIMSLNFLTRNCKEDGLLVPSTDPALCTAYIPLLVKSIEGRLGTLTSQYLYSDNLVKAPPEWPEHAMEMLRALEEYKAMGGEYSVERALIRTMKDKAEGRSDRTVFLGVPEASPVDAMKRPPAPPRQRSFYQQDGQGAQQGGPQGSYIQGQKGGYNANANQQGGYNQGQQGYYQNQQGYNQNQQGYNQVQKRGYNLVQPGYNQGQQGSYNQGQQNYNQNQQGGCNQGQQGYNQGVQQGYIIQGPEQYGNQVPNNQMTQNGPQNYANNQGMNNTNNSNNSNNTNNMPIGQLPLNFDKMVPIAFVPASSLKLDQLKTQESVTACEQGTAVKTGIQSQEQVLGKVIEPPVQVIDTQSQMQPQTIQGKMIQAQPQTLQGQAQVMQTLPQVMQDQPKILQGQPQTIQGQPQVFSSHTVLPCPDVQIMQENRREGGSDSRDYYSRLNHSRDNERESESNNLKPKSLIEKAPPTGSDPRLEILYE